MRSSQIIHGQGPGCSSVGAGAFMEHGPFRPKGEALVKNEYSWNKVANMLYLESPAGVGFSYFKNESFFYNLNDEVTARDNVKFLSRWFVPFSKYKKNDFYIAGESYGGHYVPQLAQILVNEKWDVKRIAIGNPLLEFETDFNAEDLFFWSHSMISDETYHLANTVCNSSRLLRETLTGSISSQCLYVYNITNQEISRSINKYDVTADVCLETSPSQADVLLLKSRVSQILTANDRFLVQKSSTKKQGVSDGNDVCNEQETTKYLNRKDVQTALHAKLVNYDSWVLCSIVSTIYDPREREIPTIGTVGKLVQSGLRVLVYSGDQDGVIPFIGTRRLIKNLASKLKLKTTVKYRTWIEREQVGGWTEVYGRNKLTYATIRGAAHTAPANQPKRSLVLFKAYISGTLLPSE
ncbi:hypothetical protein ACFE04_031125 [Oxalis oulophora]